MKDISYIEVEMKKSYGNTLYYPVCSKALMFTSLTGTKTLNADMLKTIECIGHSVKVTVDINNKKSLILIFIAQIYLFSKIMNYILNFRFFFFSPIKIF